MNVGFLSFDPDSFKTIREILQKIREPGALDEIGIGRYRDAFAEELFPGMSTLQHHAKYFVLLPALFNDLSQGSYKSIKDVREAVIKSEINLTQKLLLVNENATGITGSLVVEEAKKNPKKYVKYDPTYIYMSGLRTFELVNSKMSANQIIWYMSQQKRDKGTEHKNGSFGGLDQPFSFCRSVKYDFNDLTKGISLKLEKEEAAFLKERIENSISSKDSFLAHLLRKNFLITMKTEYEDLEAFMKEWDEKFQTVYKMSMVFSRFVELLRIRYLIYFAILDKQTQLKEENERKFEELWAKYKDTVTPAAIENIILYFQQRVDNKKIQEFCRDTVDLLCKRNFDELNNRLLLREREIKKDSVCKLDKHDQYTDHNFNVDGLNYRWDLVKVIISEIREGIKHE